LLDDAFASLATAQAHAAQNLQNARALFESHLQAVFTNEIFANYTHRLSDFCERITKGSSPKWQGMAYVKKPGVLFVTSENVHENRLIVDEPKYVEERFNNKEKRSILKRGDVLTNLVGASIGRTAVYDLDDVANINQAVGLIRCHADKMYNHYLMYYLNSPSMKAHFHSNEVNNARANISLSFVSEVEVPVTTIEHQKAVVERIRDFHRETQRLESIYQRKLAAIDEFKKSILHQAFSGEL
jgi:restriction endonuclease S subunit